MWGNILIKNNNGMGIFLSTKHKGSLLLQIVQNCLKKNQKIWGQTGVFTHLMYLEMTQGHGDSFKDFSISTEMSENDTWIVGVDDKKQLVGMFFEDGRLLRSWDFKIFLELPSRSVRSTINFYGGYYFAQLDNNSKELFNLESKNYMFARNHY